MLADIKSKIPIMGTKVNNFQNNAKNSNIILTSESNEMEFSKEIETVSSFKNSDFIELKIIVIDHEQYFIGSPIASFLGYTNPRKAIRDGNYIQLYTTNTPICFHI